MPCSDSSSSIVLELDSNENFNAFNYAKITCGREISADTGLTKYYSGHSLMNILEKPFAVIQTELKIEEEETLFILYMEWAALRSAIAQYLGLENPLYDAERCQISAIEHTEEGSEIALIILPPDEMPKILPCSLGDSKS